MSINCLKIRFLDEITFYMCSGIDVLSGCVSATDLLVLLFVSQQDCTEVIKQVIEKCVLEIDILFENKFQMLNPNI